jgi:hypothetical protein
MAVVRSLLSYGTTKLGKSIFGWSIPAVRTCPGKSLICSKACYAKRGRFTTNRVKALMQWRYEQSKKPGFVDAMCDEIFRRGVLVLRVAVSGDFYNPAYTAKWVEIARRCPNTRMFGYTRSWRIPAIVPYLRALASLENFRLWYSADEDTGFPDDVPSGVRVCWLQHNGQHAPHQVNLVFQVRQVRAKVGQISLPMVCPAETPEGKTKGSNCSNCASCWK